MTPSSFGVGLLPRYGGWANPRVSTSNLQHPPGNIRLAQHPSTASWDKVDCDYHALRNGDLLALNFPSYELLEVAYWRPWSTTNPRQIIGTHLFFPAQHRNFNIWFHTMATLEETSCPREPPIETILNVLHLHLKDAAAQLGIPYRTLSKAWKRTGLGKWPARKVQAQLKHQEV